MNMNELKIFENPEFGAIRTVVIDNEPWFAGTDVAKALGYVKPQDAVSRHCKHSVKHGVPASGTGAVVEMNFIPESDLYRLTMKSQLPSAEKFSDWVVEEILPSIRKNGGYIQNQERMTPEQIVANALIVANKIIAEKEAKIVEMKPKAEYFDNLVDSKLLTTFRDTAKELHIPPQQFTRWLIDNKYVYRDRHNMLKPYETHRKSGLFQMKDFSTPFGYSNVQTYVTVKGKETFRLLIGGAK